MDSLFIRFISYFVSLMKRTENEPILRDYSLAQGIGTMRLCFLDSLAILREVWRNGW